MRLTITLAVTLMLATPLVAVDKIAADNVVTYKTTTGRRGQKVELQLHIFHPPGHSSNDTRPAIVFFFSGGWNVGSPEQFFPQCKYLASRGMVAMSAEYRVKSRDGTSPRECVKDAKSAIRWIRNHAAELGIDTNRLAAGGGSAGGHIAAAAATVPGFNEAGDDQDVSCIPNALVLFNPPLDNGPKQIPPGVGRDLPNLPERKQAGWGYGRVRDYWRGFSPMHNIHLETPPTIIFLGADDAYISSATMGEFKQRMEAWGRRCELHVYENQPHEFYNAANDNKYFKATLMKASRFLESLGFLSEIVR